MTFELINCLRVKYDGVPPTIITSRGGIVINNTRTSSTLKIYQVHASDAGTYAIQAYHNGSSLEQRLNFTLEVLGNLFTLNYNSFGKKKKFFN